MAFPNSSVNVLTNPHHTAVISVHSSNLVADQTEGPETHSIGMANQFSGSVSLETEASMQQPAFPQSSLVVWAVSGFWMSIKSEVSTGRMQVGAVGRWEVNWYVLGFGTLCMLCFPVTIVAQTILRVAGSDKMRLPVLLLNHRGSIIPELFLGVRQKSRLRPEVVPGVPAAGITGLPFGAIVCIMAWASFLSWLVAHALGENSATPVNEIILDVTLLHQRFSLSMYAST
jgi:hypothetical protein